MRLVVNLSKNGRNLELVSDDAGAMANVLNYYPNAIGGRMRLNAFLPVDTDRDPIIGTFRADDFTVIRAPVLAQMLNLVSLFGPLDLLGGDGIKFSRLDIPFEKFKDKIKITNARAVGPTIGLKTSLFRDLRRDEIKAEGVMVPSYTINSVLGSIPLIGKILVGDSGEGVLAFTFRVEGSTKSPRVIVNPLSALAPGFLRNIFKGLEFPLTIDNVIAPEH